jgi:16S rRNA (cytidine1402-2'-O)-methyltransferase
VTGSLFVVATPIGNLGDITRRAVDVLGSVDAVLAEDTRHTRPLLDHLGLHVPTEALHEHNEAAMVPRLLARLQGGASLALVSDAGTPLVSDPGSRLVAAAIDAGISVVPVPGASALLAALVGAGFAAVPFSFYGFLPRKGNERTAAIAAMLAQPHTVACYEAPPRLAATLADFAAAGAGARRAVVARELTKKFEEFRRGTVAELGAYYDEHPPRGELVLVLEGAPPPSPVDPGALAARAAALRAQGLTARDTTQVLMDEFGCPRNAAYRAAHEG